MTSERPPGEEEDWTGANPPVAGPGPGYLCQADGTAHTALTFSWTEHLAAVLGTDDPEDQLEMLRLSKVRRELTRTDPLAFGVIYLSHHLRGKSTGDEITFSDAHLAWARSALQWLRDVGEPRADRHAEFAPRDTGKTTWWFLVIPLWAAAHRVARFIAAFADTFDQSVGHLRTFRQELAENDLVRRDYGGLCYTTRNSELRALLVDNASMLITANGFVFAARGADTSSLGLKVREQRPDLIILDDIEPDEANYSLKSVQKRQHTLEDAILPLNEFARVVWVGTTTRHGGLAHQLVQHANGSETADWIATQRFTARRWPPIITEDDGTERSVWPAKWSMEYLNSVRGTRSYAKNMDNEPVSDNGDFWDKEDFTYGPVAVPVARTILVLDPDVNDLHSESDWTGVCVAGLGVGPWSGVWVREIAQVRKTGQALRDYALTVLGRFPEIRRVVIECNQGVTLWLNVFKDFPVPVDLVMADFPKPVRAGMALAHYQARPTKVVHEKPFVKAEGQMCAFPNTANDDMVDAVSWAVRYLLEPETIRRPKGFVMKRRVADTTSSYV